MNATYDFEAIGTAWSIETPSELSMAVVSRIRQVAEDFDRTYSRFRPDSLITEFARTGGVCELPRQAAPLLAFYRELYDVTGHRVSPLVGNALEHLGYDATYSLRRHPGSASVPDWDDVLRIEGSVMTATEPVLLDLGAAGKGYLVDLLAEVLDAAGFTEHVVDGSGDLMRRGQGVFRVGLEHPHYPGKVIGVANVGNGALCGSATNRRTWGDGLHHIVDPSTAEPTHGVLATWVTADSAMLADGLATALFLTDAATLAQRYSFSYVRMLAAGGVEYSTNFDGELFT